MASQLKTASPQERPSTPPSSLPPITAVSSDHFPTTQPLGATANDVRVPAAAESLDPAQHGGDQARQSIPKGITRRLYISHFFSTWNSRSFEFGAVLFTASIFPMTLLPLSIYALVWSSSALCAILNLVAVERDWAVVIAGNDERCLQALNARMRRIDLFCKLVGPLFIALIDGASTKIAIFVTFGINLLSIPIEYFAIAQVYNVVPLLQGPKVLALPTVEGEASEPSPSRSPRLVPRWTYVLYEIFKFYYQHQAFLPSFALSLLYLTVLSLGGQMATYLISAGYNSFYIALVRTLSVIFELSATWIAPRLMKRIHPARVGMWFLSWQMLWLGAAVSFFWAEPVSIVAASGLVAGTILSRIGLWGYDLCAQFIIQEVSIALQVVTW
ncbi:MAG: hypothetical protein Q9163_006418 [Psora crenata]